MAMARRVVAAPAEVASWGGHPLPEPLSSSSSSSLSLIQALLQLSSQQVQQLHSSLPSCPADAADIQASESIWLAAEEASSRRRSELTPTAASSTTSSSSSSLLSPDAMHSALYTYQQLCHDMPLLTVDGVNALTAALQRHVAQQTLPSFLFALNLPFLYQLLEQCSRCIPAAIPSSSAASSSSAPQQLSTALSALYCTVVLSLLPVLLTAELSSLRSFLSFIPVSLRQSIESLLSLQQEQHQSVPSFLIPPHDDTAAQEHKTADDPDGSTEDEGFVLEADELSEDDHADTSTHSQQINGEAAGAALWHEAEQKLCVLAELWTDSWVQSAQQQQQVAAVLPVLLHIHTLSQRHEHMFVASSPAAALLTHHIARLFSSLLLTTPALLPSYLPPLLSSVLGVSSITTDTFSPSLPVSSARMDEERKALLLVARLCSSELPTSASSYLYRLVDSNLLWLSSFTAALVASPAPSSSRWSHSLDAVVSIAGFYSLHPSAATSDEPCRELVAAGMVSELLSLLPVLPDGSSVFRFLLSASAVSASVAALLTRDSGYRQRVVAGQALGEEAVLSPLFLSLRRLHGQVEAEEVAVTTRTTKADARGAGGSDRTGRKGKARLTVTALQDEEEAADSGVEEGKAAEDVVVSALVPALQRSVHMMREASAQAFASAPSQSSSSSLVLLADVIDTVSRITVSSPLFAAILLPYFHSPLSPPTAAQQHDHTDSLVELQRLVRDWATTVGEVRTECAARLKRTPGRQDATEEAPVEGDDSERRRRAKSRQAVRFAVEQHTALMHRVLLACKPLLQDGSKKD